MKSFLKVLTEKSHLSLLPEISEEYTKMLISFRNSTNVKIVTASVLKESYGLLLLNTLRNLTNSKEIILNVLYNPKLLGGLVIEYNSKSIDASILKEFSLFFNEV
jgi:F0F1-type ATP synthase delta subunit